MPQFAILRMERHPVSFPLPDGEMISGVAIKPMPLALVHGQPLAYEAETPEIALAFAIRRYPHFRHLLATQDLSAYVVQHSPSSNTGRVLRGAKARSPDA